MYQTCTEFGFYQTSDSEKQPFGKLFPLKYVLRKFLHPASFYPKVPKGYRCSGYQGLGRKCRAPGLLGGKIGDLGSI